MWDARRNNRSVTYPAPETKPSSFRRRVLCIPNNLRVIAAVNEALDYLCKEKTWEGSIGVSSREMAEMMTTMFLGYLKEGETMIGEVKIFFTDFIPDNCLLMDGSTHAKADYPDLYVRLPDAYVDTVNETFTLPDMAGFFVMGETETEPLGATGGQAEVTLSVNEMPAHDHTTLPHSHFTNYPSISLDLESAGVPDITGIGNPAFPSQVSSSETVTVNSTGGGEAHENRPPFLSVKFAIVALKGCDC